MSIPRLHLDTPLAEGATVEAAPGQAHHLGTVLRRGPGDALRLFNAADGEFEARIATLRKDRASFAIGPRRRAPAPEPGPILLLALLKREPMDWAVEKATELGAAAIHPVITRRTVAERTNAQRLSAIARAAAEQCERLTIPEIAEPQPLHRILDAWPGGALVVAAERSAAPPLREALARALRRDAPAGGLSQNAPAGALRRDAPAGALPRDAPAGAMHPLALLVGPEGGFDPPELDDLRRRSFVVPAALGPRILRAETAAVAGLAALQALAGDWT